MPRAVFMRRAAREAARMRTSKEGLGLQMIWWGSDIEMRPVRVPVTPAADDDVDADA